MPFIVTLPFDNEPFNLATSEATVSFIPKEYDDVLLEEQGFTYIYCSPSPISPSVVARLIVVIPFVKVP